MTFHCKHTRCFEFRLLMNEGFLEEGWGCACQSTDIYIQYLYTISYLISRILC